MLDWSNCLILLIQQMGESELQKGKFKPLNQYHVVLY